jgi:hypothetical protein
MWSKLEELIERFERPIVRWAVFGLVAGVFLLTNSILWNAEGAQRANQQNAKVHAAYYAEEARAHAQRECGKALPAEKHDCTEAIYEEAREQQRREYEIEASRDSAVWNEAMGRAEVLGGIYGVVTIVFVFAAFLLQRRAYDQATNDSREARREAADAVAASREANELTASLFETETRPVMVPDGIELDEHIRGGDMIMFRFRWKNVGRLPAIISGGQSRMFPDPERANVGLAGLVPQTADDLPGNTVIPHGETHVSEPLFFNLIHAKAGLHLGQAILKYRTALGGKRDWSTEVEGMFEPSLDVEASPDGQITISTHPIPQPHATGLRGLRFKAKRDGVKMI